MTAGQNSWLIRTAFWLLLFPRILYNFEGVMMIYMLALKYTNNEVFYGNNKDIMQVQITIDGTGTWWRCSYGGA